MAALPREAPSVNVASWTVRAELQAVSGTSTLVAKVCHATVFVKSWHHWISWGAQLLFLSGEWFWMLRCPGPTTTKRSGHCCCVIFYLKKSKYCYSNCFSFVSSVQATEFVVHKKTAYLSALYRFRGATSCTTRGSLKGRLLLSELIITRIILLGYPQGAIYYGKKSIQSLFTLATSIF